NSWQDRGGRMPKLICAIHSTKMNTFMNINIKIPDRTKRDPIRQRKRRRQHRDIKHGRTAANYSLPASGEYKKGVRKNMVKLLSLWMPNNRIRVYKCMKPVKSK